MINRRKLLLGIGSALLAGASVVPDEAFAAKWQSPFYFDRKTGRWKKRPRAVKKRVKNNKKLARTRAKPRNRAKKKKFELNPKYEPTKVRYDKGYKPGTIIVETGERFLYLVEKGGYAIRYGVGVGRDGQAWSGTAKVGRKVEWPSWTPTPGMIKREPEKYLKYADGVPGGPKNPLGARALYLYKGKADTQFRIHGTTAPWSIGSATSNGCIRMVNEHVIDLYERVPIGAKVIVI